MTILRILFLFGMRNHFFSIKWFDILKNRYYRKYQYVPFDTSIESSIDILKYRNVPSHRDLFKKTRDTR